MLPAPPSHQITTPFRAGDIAWVAQPAGALEGMRPPANRVKAEISGSAVCSAAIVMAVLFVMGGVWRQRQAAPEPLLGVATVPMPSHVRLRMRRVHDPPDYIAFRGKAPDEPATGGRQSLTEREFALAGYIRCRVHSIPGQEHYEQIWKWAEELDELLGTDPYPRALLKGKQCPFYDAKGHDEHVHWVMEKVYRRVQRVYCPFCRHQVRFYSSR
eukprot:EG_transcript_27455